MQRLRSHHERRTHGVEGELLKVITRLLGQDLVDHEGLVAPPGSLELPGGGEPQLGLAVHGVPPPSFSGNLFTSGQLLPRLRLRQVEEKPREEGESAPAGVHAFKQVIVTTHADVEIIKIEG